jgi:hypothetical protein
MLILGKNRDYYDGVVGTVGIDKTIVYNRKTEEFEDKIPDEFTSTYNLNIYSLNERGKEKYKYFTYFVICFCGKTYIGWKLLTKNDKVKIIYGINNIKEFITGTNWSRGVSFIDMYQGLLQHDFIDIYRKYNTPIFMYDSNANSFQIQYNHIRKFIINPILKEYKFYRVLDAYTVFQEIMMFIGGVLGTNENNIIDVDDKYKISQHGFDKWSFRKEPEKRNNYGRYKNI